MSNLLLEKKDQVVKWFYPWLKLNQDGAPEVSINLMLKQPEMVKICWEQTANDRRDRPHEVAVDIVPVKGLFGWEFALVYTILQFDKKS